MEFVNSVNESNSGSVDLESAKKLVILLAPYAPFTAEELWKQLGQKDSVHEQLFPDYNSSLIVSDTINVPVCINGKVRDQLELAVEEADSQEMVVAKAMKLAKISKDFELKSIKKIVYVKGKMLNLVV
jgi:leucyl-tRNA synthetase